MDHAPESDAIKALAAYKTKTAQWKQVVKRQLDSAAEKNEALRKELSAVKAEAVNAAKNVRLELTAEFKERSEMKDDDISRLEKELVLLRQELADERVRLRNEARQAGEREEGIHQQAILAMQKEAEAAAARASDIHRAELERERSKAEMYRIEVADARANAESAKYSLAALESQVTGDNTSRETDEEVAGLQNQLQLAHEQIEKWQHRHAADAERYEANLEQLTESRDARNMAEIARRDEQLAVTQSILRATQRDLQTSLIRQGEKDAETAEQVNTLRGRISRLTMELAAKMEQLGKAEVTLSHVQSMNTALEQRVSSLTEEAAGREAAFNEMFVSGSDSQTEVFHRLQEQLAAMKTERDASCAKHMRLEDELRSMKEQQEGAHAHDHNKQNELSELQRQIDAHERSLSQREQNLLDMKQQLVQEAARLEEMQTMLHKRSNRPSSDTGSSVSISSSASSSAYRIGPAPNITRDAAVMAFLRYRKFFPFMILLLMLVMIIWWSSSGASAAGFENKASMQQLEEATRLRQSVSSLQYDLSVCLSQAKERDPKPPFTAAASSIPSPVNR